MKTVKLSDVRSCYTQFQTAMDNINMKYFTSDSSWLINLCFLWLCALQRMKVDIIHPNQEHWTKATLSQQIHLQSQPFGCVVLICHCAKNKRLHYWPEYKSAHKIQYCLFFPLGLGVHFVSSHLNIATQINKKIQMLL